MSLHEFIPMLVRQRRKMGAFALAVFLVTGVITLLTPNVYRAQAKLFVRVGRENATLDPTATLGQTQVVAVQQSRENEINTAVEVLTSRVLLEQVVDAVGPAAVLKGRAGSPLDPADASPETAALRYAAGVKLAKMLDVEPVKRSNVLVISCDGPSPAVAEAVVAKLLECYLERHIHLSRTPGAHQFLEQQTAQQQARLARTEEELRDLKTATGLVSPDGRRQLLVARVGRLEDELLQTAGALTAAEAEVQRLRERVAALSPTQVTGRTKGVRNEATDNMRGQLYTLELKELELRQKYPAGHPDLQRISQQVAAARDLVRREEQAREQVTEGPNRAYEEAQLTLMRQEPALASLRAKADTLRGQLDRQRAELGTLNENMLRVVRLEREAALQESQYRRYADHLAQSQADRALEAERLSNISVVQPAMSDPSPVRPRWRVNFGLGVLVALAGALAVAVGAERLAPTVTSAGELERRLGLPVLATVPHLEALAPFDWAGWYESLTRPKPTAAPANGTATDRRPVHRFLAAVSRTWPAVGRRLRPSANGGPHPLPTGAAGPWRRR